MQTLSTSSRRTGPRAVRALVLILLSACGADKGGEVDDTEPPDETSSGADDTSGSGDSAPELRWTGTATALVTDDDGAPVEGAWVLVGGASEDEWALTDADGYATVTVTDDGITDRWLIAAKEGWRSGGKNLRETEAPDDPVEIGLHLAPIDDNAEYHFQPGGNGHSPDTSECGHCHNTIADDWESSAHQSSGRNTHTWDLFTGAASGVDPEDCESVAGWAVEGQVPGQEGETALVCATGLGVLPFLNPACGGPDEPACDHPDERGALTAFGSCGDCHTPAIDGGVAGAINLVAATGVAYDEGVTCDLCHKVGSVTAGASPGLDGALHLNRPSEPTSITGQEFEPVTFGPYPDVIVAIMKGSWAPGMRDADWCSSCHEYARGSLSADAAIDADRWPDGLPLHETWSEWTRGPRGGTEYGCQYCHMTILDEESSTYDISAKGLEPSVDQGWLRPYGDVRHHDWPGGGVLDPPELSVTVDWDAETLDVSVTNDEAGHAIPTGEPLRQYLVRVEVQDDAGAALVPASGPTVPDVGGALASGTVGDGVTVEGDVVTFAAGDLPGGAIALRFVRPTGTWASDPGPGSTWQDGLEDAERGLPLAAALGEIAVLGVSGGVVTLAEAAPETADGDLVYLVGDADYAGAAGWLWAKTLVDAEGVRGVAHYRAVDIASDNRIAPDATATLSFTLPDGAARVAVRLVYRAYAAPVARLYGWDRGDVEAASFEDARPE